MELKEILVETLSTKILTAIDQTYVGSEHPEMKVLKNYAASIIIQMLHETTTIFISIKEDTIQIRVIDTSKEISRMTTKIKMASSPKMLHTTAEHVISLHDPNYDQKTMSTITSIFLEDMQKAQLQRRL